jgi:hypothetical protein
MSIVDIKRLEDINHEKSTAPQPFEKRNEPAAVSVDRGERAEMGDDDDAARTDFVHMSVIRKIRA